MATVPINQNILANGLAFSASTCQLLHPNKQYTMHVKHCPTVPDNMRYWQVFGDEKQIENFLQSKGEFEDSSLDLDFE